MMSELASLNKLSPSRMADIRLGIFTNFIMAAADTASGGETMPPNKKPRATEKPGIKVLAINPTTRAVINTTIKANEPIILRHRHSSFHELLYAASYSIGGKNTRNIKSGLILKRGMPGMKLIATPPNTSIMG